MLTGLQDGVVPCESSSWDQQTNAGSSSNNNVRNRREMHTDCLLRPSTNTDTLTSAHVLWAKASHKPNSNGAGKDTPPVPGVTVMSHRKGLDSGRLKY